VGKHNAGTNRPTPEHLRAKRKVPLLAAKAGRHNLNLPTVYRRRATNPRTGRPGR